DGLSRRERKQRIHRPAPDKAVQYTVHVSSQPTFAAKWQLVYRRQRETLGRIVGADRVLRLQVVNILRSSLARAAEIDPVIRAIGGRIGRLRPGVAPLEAQPVGGALLKA